MSNFDEFDPFATFFLRAIRWVVGKVKEEVGIEEWDDVGVGDEENFTGLLPYFMLTEEHTFYFKQSDEQTVSVQCMYWSSLESKRTPSYASRVDSPKLPVKSEATTPAPGRSGW